MSSTLLFVIAGCLLGLVQLAAGIAIGVWLRRPDSGNRDADLRRTRSLALELHSLTQHIGSQVATHRERFEKMEDRLQQSPGGKQNPTTDLVVGVVNEILAANRQLQSELHDAENRIAQQSREIESHLNSSLTDALTQLPNRRALDEQLAAKLKEFRRHGTPFSVMMVDADHFKSVNDSFGHVVGDEVLTSMGSALKSALRKHDFVGRYGGEEFAVVFPHTTLEEAQRAAGKAREGLAILNDQFIHLGRPITASGGLATICPGEEVESLIARADEALYYAKRNGRNRTCLHDGQECRDLDDSFATGSNWDETLAIEDPSALGQLSSPVASAAMSDACDDLRFAVLGSGNSND